MVALFLVLLPLFCSANILTPKENEQLQKTCGRLPTTRVKRSTNGMRVDQEKAPWVSAIGIGVNDIYCSAVWISDRHLLTAAHCVNSVFSIQDLVFKPYIINTRNTEGQWEYEPIEAFQVQKVHYPWLFFSKTPGTFGDIALVEVQPAKDFVPISLPACLPKNDLLLGTVVTMYGYGYNVAENKNGSLGVMRSVMSSTTLCPMHGVFSICFNGFPYLACHGDSGGPVLSVTEDEKTGKRYEVNGIMATINHACQKNMWNDVLLGYMNTATNVNYHTDWICHASGICPSEELRKAVKEFDGVVRTKYRTFTVMELDRLKLAMKEE